MALDRGESMPGVRTRPIAGDDLAAREERHHRARLAVARASLELPENERAADCSWLLDMLGLHPHQADHGIAY